MDTVSYQDRAIFAVATGIKGTIKGTAQITVVIIISVLGEEELVATTASKGLICIACLAIREPEVTRSADTITLVTSDQEVIRL